MWVLCFSFFFFFKQKTAYDMRISDWSSYVCSSDLGVGGKLYTITGNSRSAPIVAIRFRSPLCLLISHLLTCFRCQGAGRLDAAAPRRVDRSSVRYVKSMSVRVALGGRQIIKKKKSTNYYLYNKT